jgi:hypothetical protein
MICYFVHFARSHNLASRVPALGFFRLQFANFCEEKMDKNKDVNIVDLYVTPLARVISANMAP